MLAIATAAPRVWLVPRFWVEAGVGAGWLLVSGGGAGQDGAEFGPAAMIAAGGEPGRQRCSGIDLSVRLGGARVRYDADDRVVVHGIAAVVGYHWN